MDLYAFKDLISSLAVITTILQFLSGVLVCKQYVANRSTAETSPLLFICGVLSCGTWLMYGIAKHDDIIVLVNIIGVTLMSAYTAVFYIFTFKKAAVLKQVIAVVAIIVLIAGYSVTEADRNLLLSRLGLLACGLTLATIAAPMSKLFYVLKVKSTECLPFPMILMMFLVSSLWFLYGVIEGDAYLVVPNFGGAALALCQLSLFALFPRRPQQTSFTKPLLA